MEAKMVFHELFTLDSTYLTHFVSVFSILVLYNYFLVFVNLGIWRWISKLLFRKLTLPLPEVQFSFQFAGIKLDCNHCNYYIGFSEGSWFSYVDATRIITEIESLILVEFAALPPHGTVPQCNNAAMYQVPGMYCYFQSKAF